MNNSNADFLIYISLLFNLVYWINYRSLKYIKYSTGGHGKIADGNELQGVLDDIKNGWDGEFPAVWAEYLATYLQEQGCPWEG
jgi:hypothetical protein